MKYHEQSGFCGVLLYIELQEVNTLASEKFMINNYSIDNILNMIDAKQFVIPEIQRPFVWKKERVRDLIDSLYNGYPIGYIITWRNPDVHTKDGNISRGAYVLIDGQQRITSLMTAIAGKEVLDTNFDKKRICIAYNPLSEDPTKRFAVQNSNHLKDRRWIADIAEVFRPGFQLYSFVKNYVANNKGSIEEDDIAAKISELQSINNSRLGFIELNPTLDIEEVTEIFSRINTKGTPLATADFVMSKMASNISYGGNLLRKAIDYFCHLILHPNFIEQIHEDEEFMNSVYAYKIEGLAKGYKSTYVPDFKDVISVAFMCEFNRSSLPDLVSFLSGRDFKTREFREDVMENSYEKMQRGVLAFMNKYSLEEFSLAIRSVGLSSPKLLGSKIALNFAYMLFIRLREDEKPLNIVRKLVARWLVFSTLTERYTKTSTNDYLKQDLKDIQSKRFETFMLEAERVTLSNFFWDTVLPHKLESDKTKNNVPFHIFLAAQAYFRADSLFMRGLTVADLLEVSGEKHHIFPKEYLKQNGIGDSSRYNQVANYTYINAQVNKAIGASAPKDYFTKVLEQCKEKSLKLGNITDEDILKENLRMNAIPEEISQMEARDYDDFLKKRRQLMAKIIREYYESL